MFHAVALYPPSPYRDDLVSRRYSLSNVFYKNVNTVHTRRQRERYEDNGQVLTIYIRSSSPLSQ